MTLTAAAPAPVWIVVVVTVVGALVGVLLARILTSGTYRLDDEQDRPPSRWGPLVAAAVPVLWGLLAWQLGGLAAGALLPAYLLLAVVGVALFWIDVDVHRLPEGLTLPSVAALVVLLAIAGATDGDWGSFGRALACGVGVWVVYLVLALISPGGLGLGDATLGGLVSLPLGYLGWGAPVLALVAAYVTSGIVALVGLALRRLTLKSDIAFGPFILIGALAAVFVRFQMLGG